MRTRTIMNLALACMATVVALLWLGELLENYR
jgi:hypothetical protein